MSGTGFTWHAEQWRRLAEARRSGRLPHALLLSGPQGLGKAAFSRRLSDALVCTSPLPSGDACGGCTGCRQSRAGSHPDQHFVSPEERGKQIKIDAIRSLTSKSVLAAQQDSYRVFVVEPAEAMNRAAANALLKTLEEPVSRTVLILVSSHPHRLPATIRSRCQVQQFRIPQSEEVRGWLTTETGEEQSDALLAISGGAPLRALMARDEDWIGEDKRLIGELAALKARKTNPLQVVEEWEKRPLHSLVDGLKRCLSDLVKLAVGLGHHSIYHAESYEELQSLGQGIDLQSLYRFNDELLELDRVSANNLNVQMMLEHLANRWLQITRPGVH